MLALSLPAKRISAGALCPFGGRVRCAQQRYCQQMRPRALPQTQGSTRGPDAAGNRSVLFNRVAKKETAPKGGQLNSIAGLGFKARLVICYRNSFTSATAAAISSAAAPLLGGLVALHWALFYWRFNAHGLGLLGEI